jgi:hypothetical protein
MDKFLDIESIFSEDKELMEHPSVTKLIEYIQELEGVIMETRIGDSYSKETILKDMVMEIYKDTSHLLKRDEENERFRFKETINYKKAIISLKNYIFEMNEGYNLKLF